MNAPAATVPTLSAAAIAAAAPPPLARIAKITIEDYRAFPAGDTLLIDLGPTGKNLLLYGENGSGKTSLARAMRDLTANRNASPKLESDRHLFGPPIEAAKSLVAVEFTAGTVNEFRWRAGDLHPRETDGRNFQEFARACLSLDYRDLLETNFRHDGTPNLFDCLLATVLDGLPVLHGGSKARLGELHRAALRSRPHYRTERALDRVTRACEAFTVALENHLPEVVAAARSIFARLGHAGTDFALTPHAFAYDRERKNFTVGRITFEVTHHGRPLVTPQHFLNEARLTALALSLYLGAAQIAITAQIPRAGAPAFARVLFLDDVLIGLDLSNRLPLLRVLAEDFADWQIILLTHDRVWFELAKEHTEHDGNWLAKELCALEMPGGQAPRPVVKDSTDYLTRAKNHLAATPPDLMAAAVYVRAAFETKLKNICEDRGIEVAFKSQPKEVKADTLWSGIVERQKKRAQYQTENPGMKAPDFLPAHLVADVETMRSSILNRLSHSGTPTLVKDEVEFALRAVTALIAHDFPGIPKTKPPPSSTKAGG